MLDADVGRLFTIDPASGSRTRLAHCLAFGYLRDPCPRSGGLAVGSDRAICVAADIENAVDRVSPRPSNPDEG